MQKWGLAPVSPTIREPLDHGEPLICSSEDVLAAGVEGAGREPPVCPAPPGGLPQSLADPILPTAADGGVAAVTSTQELRLAVEARLAHVEKAKAEGERVIALITRHADYLISNPGLIPTDDLIQENTALGPY